MAVSSVMKYVFIVFMFLFVLGIVILIMNSAGGLVTNYGGVLR